MTLLKMSFKDELTLFTIFGEPSILSHWLINSHCYEGAFCYCQNTRVHESDRAYQDVESLSGKSDWAHCSESRPQGWVLTMPIE